MRHTASVCPGSLNYRVRAASGSGEDLRHFVSGNLYESLHDVWIELPARVSHQPPDGFFVREPFAVTAVGDHGIIRINDCNDARTDRNFRPFQLPWIAIA